MKKTRIVLVIWLLALPASHSAFANTVPLSKTLQSAGFSKVGTKNGVTMYKHSRDKAIAAEGIFAGTPKQVLAALLAYDKHRAFNKRIAESRVFLKGKDWLLVYQRLDLPMISDRDYTLRIKWGEKDGITWMSFWTDNVRGPGKKSGVVRLYTHRGSWQLRPLASGRTFARYQVKIDLGGWVPGFLARSGTRKELPRLFSGLNRLAKQLSRLAAVH
jgi:hypothetical protein